jgi:hypothetical protein
VDAVFTPVAAGAGDGGIPGARGRVDRVHA